MTMVLDEVMGKLESMGAEQTKQIFLRHGAVEPLFGVKVGDMKKLVKDIKKDQELARALYDTGNSDAMYLAGLTVDPKTATKEMLQDWVRRTGWYMLAEYTVAWIAAESPHAVELAREWIESPDEMIATCGWSTYTNYITITEDKDLDIEEIRELLRRVVTTIHGERNRVRYNMNGFVIAVGASVIPLHGEATDAAEKIGKVESMSDKRHAKCLWRPNIFAKSKKPGKPARRKRLAFVSGQAKKTIGSFSFRWSSCVIWR